MRRALVASVALALGCGPVGVFLLLRRMSLVGDALSHAILPGAAAAFLVAGLSLGAMALGGFAAALLTALAAGALSRVTPLREDATFAVFYLFSLALGVLLVSFGGTGIDLLHVLFGSVLAVDDAALVAIADSTGPTPQTSVRHPPDGASSRAVAAITRIRVRSVIADGSVIVTHHRPTRDAEVMARVMLADRHEADEPESADAGHALDISGGGRGDGHRDALRDILGHPGEATAAHHGPVLLRHPPDGITHAPRARDREGRSPGDGSHGDLCP